VFNPFASSDVGGVHGFVDLGVDPETFSVPPRRLSLAALVALVASATTVLTVFANGRLEVLGRERSLNAWALDVVSDGGGPCASSHLVHTVALGSRTSPTCS
jgi:hypothetical protein